MSAKRNYQLLSTIILKEELIGVHLVKFKDTVGQLAQLSIYNIYIILLSLRENLK